MKKIFMAVFVLVLSSVACQTLMPDRQPPSAQEMPVETEAGSPVVTEAPVVSTRTPRPTPHPITCEDDSCLEACLIRINNALETHQFDSVGGLYAGKEASLNLVSYKVTNGELSEPKLLYVPEEFRAFQEDYEAQQVVWNYASSMLPPEQRKLITEYYIFTDDPSNVLAWVNNSDQYDRSSWQLGIDILDAQDPVYLTETLVHEYGHLITLNSDQIPDSDFYYGWDQNPATCKQFLSPEGCSKPDSYINLFYRDFWLDIFPDWREMVEKPHTDTDDEFYDLVYRFYREHEDEFVREYAATNIREDMAESFMHFVLDPKPEGNTVIERKILFYYDFPELVALRQQMIQNICSYTQE